MTDVKAGEGSITKPGNDNVLLSHGKIPVLVYKPAPPDHRVHKERRHADQ